MYANKMEDMNIKRMMPYAGERIQAFINDKGLNSANTKKAYEGDIRHFFKEFFGKDYMFVTEAELEEIQHYEVISYRADLVEEGASASTINRKMAALHSLFTFLAKDNQNINHMAFKLTRLKENANSYGSMSKEEGQKLVEAAKTIDEPFSVLVELAIATSIRQAALLGLTKYSFSRAQGVWIVNVIDKGSKSDEKPITEELYNKLMSMESGGKFFNFTSRHAQRQFKKACEIAGLDYVGRNLTFHSLKKVAINWILENTGDIMQATVQGNHKDINTMYKHYAKMNKNFNNMAGITMYQDEDLSILECLSHEDLLDVIKKVPKHVQMALIAEVKKERANE